MRRFFECLVPNTTCNLKCSYCYLIQQGRRTNKKAVFDYPPEIIGKALRQSRVGGVCLISMTASGETLLPPEMPDIVYCVLKEGHFVNITTNGTLTTQIINLLKKTEGYHSHLHISFFLYYTELIRTNLLDTFFQNINIVRECGCSILVQINLVDEYIPYWDEIKKKCIEKVGAPPQVALTRREDGTNYSILTELSQDEYIQIGKQMDSPLFECTVKNFNVKRKEYCYAGYWSGNLFLDSGIMKSCYGQGITQNIFEDINKPIIFEPIGNHCECKYCINSSHFISQGIIPELLPTLSYGELRDRSNASWYNYEMRNFLYKQFEDTNKQLSFIHKYFFKIKKSYNQSSFKKIIKFLKAIMIKVWK